MKQLNFLTLLFLFFFAAPLMAQEEDDVVVITDSAIETEAQTPEEYFDNKYYGMNQNYVDFTSDQKKFNDWTIGVYGGLSLVQGADLNSWMDNDDISNLYSYDFHAILIKQITHAFGLGAQFNWGRTEQQSINYRAHTKYWAWALMGDLNFSQLMRRVDNKSRFGWALHGYLGVGTLQYES